VLIVSLNNTLTEVLSLSILSAVTDRCFRTHVDKDIISSYGMWRLCSKFVCMFLPVPLDKLCVEASGFNLESVPYVDMELATRM
jgi:hypothetical protein